MTVIAYRDGIMASDSCWNDNGLIVTLSTKIVRLKSQALLGEAGDCDTREMQQLLDNATDPSGLPSRKDLLEVGIDYQAILVLPDGSVWDVCVDMDKKDAGVFRINRDYYAVGSGKRTALGAMWRGATADQAVHAACEWEMECRLPSNVVIL